MRILCALSILIAGVPAYAGESLQQIYDCMHRNVPRTVRVEDVEMTTTHRAGPASSIKGRLFSMLESSNDGADLVRVMFAVNAPATLTGAAYLVREMPADSPAETYVYLPAVGRVRRVVGDAGYHALFQTSFSYDEFRQTQAAFATSTAKLERTEAVDARTAYVISFNPAADQHSPYETIRLWVDQQSCVAVKADFYEGSSVRKRFVAAAKDLQQVDGRWYPSRVEMRDLRDGVSSVMRVTGVSTGVDLPGRYFNPRVYYAAK